MVKKLSMRISKHWHHHLTVVVVLVLVPLATSFSSSTLIYSPKAKPVLQMVPVEWCSLVIVSLVWLVGWFALRRLVGRGGYSLRIREEFVEVTQNHIEPLLVMFRFLISPLALHHFFYVDLPFPWEEASGRRRKIVSAHKPIFFPGTHIRLGWLDA